MNGSMNEFLIRIAELIFRKFNAENVEGCRSKNGWTNAWWHR